jgi:heterodisulfide reductase subunit C
MPTTEYLKGASIRLTKEREALDSNDESALAAVQEMLRACIQCGTCSASCPNASAMDLTPRHLWRLVQLGKVETIFRSHTFTLCSTCHFCTLRCPRGLVPAEAMAGLKRIAGRRRMRRHRESITFCRDFVENIRRNGRVQEMAFMTAYFMHMRRPNLPIRFAALGWKLQRKGKVALPRIGRSSTHLKALFRKVDELESSRNDALQRTESNRSKD